MLLLMGVSKATRPPQKKKTTKNKQKKPAKILVGTDWSLKKPLEHSPPNSKLVLGFPDSSVGKESTCNAGDPGSLPEMGKSAGEGTGYPLQDSWASLLAQLVRNIPAMWETWVRSLGWEDLLEKGRLPTPVFWPGEFHGLYSPWGHKQSDMTEQLSLQSNKHFS